MTHYTAAQINNHVKTGLKRVLLFLGSGQQLRVIAARDGTRRGGLEVQILGWENHRDGGWITVDDKRIELV
jgi:hypothetical protein